MFTNTPIVLSINRIEAEFEGSFVIAGSEARLHAPHALNEPIRAQRYDKKLKECTATCKGARAERESKSLWPSTIRSKPFAIPP